MRKSCTKQRVYYAVNVQDLLGWVIKNLEF